MKPPSPDPHSRATTNKYTKFRWMLREPMARTQKDSPVAVHVAIVRSSEHVTARRNPLGSKPTDHTAAEGTQTHTTHAVLTVSASVDTHELRARGRAELT
jgi:hypothetical protein